MTAAGITHCLHKPFSPREVLKLVDSLFTAVEGRYGQAELVHD
jgi:hypothetical protein